MHKLFQTYARNLIHFTLLIHSIFLLYVLHLKIIQKKKYPSRVTTGPTVSLFSPKTWAGRHRFCPDNSFLSYSLTLSCNCKPHLVSRVSSVILFACTHGMNNLFIMALRKTNIRWMWYTSDDDKNLYIPLCSWTIKKENSVCKEWRTQTKWKILSAFWNMAPEEYY